MQERRNSIANALEIRLSCTNPSTCDHQINDTEIVIPMRSISKTSVWYQSKLSKFQHGVNQLVKKHLVFYFFSYNIILTLPLLRQKHVLSQHHSCWCPGSLYWQVISSHDMDCAGKIGPCLRPWSSCVILGSDGKHKYTFRFPQKK